MQRKTYDILDLTKFVLSIAVVAIHCQLFPHVLFPWLRLAVPLFFIISSFLFYSKVSGLAENEQREKLFGYVKRNLTLYAVWFVILLPFTVLERKSWFANGMVQGILYSIRGFLFGSTFRASWFIMAGVIALPMVFFLSKRTKEWILTTVALLLYGCCCLVTNYSKIIESSQISFLYDFSKVVFDGIESSFVFAIIWIIIGKKYAENAITYSKKQSMIGTLISALLLYAEHYFSVNYLGASGRSSCYVMLLPLCVFVFRFLIQCEGLKIKNAKFLRNTSTILYVTHCAVLLCVSWFLRNVLSINSIVANFVVTVASVIVISYICIRLSTFSKLHFLKKLW